MFQEMNLKKYNTSWVPYNYPNLFGRLRCHCQMSKWHFKLLTLTNDTWQVLFYKFGQDLEFYLN